MRRSSGRPTKAASNNNNNNSTTTTTITTTSTRPTLSSRKRELSSTSRELLENSDTSKNKKKKQEVSIGSQIAVTAGIEVNDEEEEDEDEEEEEELGNQSTQLAKTIQSATPISVQRNVPAFLNKLYSMVDDPATDSLIRWSADGASFIVERHEHFAKTILPRFYKHNTFASFVRQLNMYDFHKIPTVQQGVLFPDTEREIWEFNHANFRRGRPDLLILVTRKKKDKEGANNGDGNDVAISLSSLVKQITSIRSHQQTITHDLHSLQRDNSILWQESLEAREKHQRHQEVIEKILQFLTAVFSSENNLLAATAAQMSGPFMLGKNNEYISLLNKEKQNILGQTPTGTLKYFSIYIYIIKLGWGRNKGGVEGYINNNNNNIYCYFDQLAKGNFFYK
ncbi:hypothetical protein BDC45DRAFT_429992 [Circinella umbellata]|nr:hypothetical protein BDC45DRAFT_429992 [Circinella umbellata]